MNYDNLTDRELDAAVAETVFSANRANDGCWEWPDSKCVSDETPKYSNDMILAFKVVEAMRHGFGFEVESNIGAEEPYSVYFGAEAYTDGREGGATDKSLPRAICLAALSALDE